MLPGQLVKGLSVREMRILSYFVDDEFSLRSLEVQLLAGEPGSDIVTSVAFFYKPLYSDCNLLRKKWRYEETFENPDPEWQEKKQQYMIMASETLLEYTTGLETPFEFQEDEVREAVRKILYKQETNRNYMGSAFVDRTPTIVHHDDF